MVRDFTAREKQIVASARSYVGVPFRHQGRSRHGLDCLGLLVCVARDCALMYGNKALYQYDDRCYGHYPDAEKLSTQLQRYLCREDCLASGKIALIKADHGARHLAIIGDYGDNSLSLIHAYAPARKVIEHRLSTDWAARIEAVFAV